MIDLPDYLTLAGFLLTRYDEDEAMAREAAFRQYTGVDPAEDVDPTAFATHFTASLALTDINAKRQIVDRYRELVTDPDFGVDPEYRSAFYEYERHVLPSLAAPYADHPEFDARWRH
jgi:hypothetical protein